MDVFRNNGLEIEWKLVNQVFIAGSAAVLLLERSFGSGKSLRVLEEI